MISRATFWTVLLSVACIPPLSVRAQDQGSEQIIMQAKRSISKGVNWANPILLLDAQARLHAVTRDDRYGSLASYYVGLADYQMGTIFPHMDKDSVVAYLESAAKWFEAAIKSNDRFAEAYALLASCYGQLMGHSPLRGITLGPKSSAALARAKGLEPENPRVVLLDAISTYNTPGLFGGSKTRGLEGFNKAAALFGRWTCSDSLLPDWGREDAYAWIGIAHLDRGETILARKAFERALEINPDFGWVKYDLLPRVTTGSKNEKP